MNFKNINETLVEALAYLRTKGYKYDFNLKPFCLECPSLQLQLRPEDFEIKEIFRFEGMSDPADNSVLYAIESKDGIKGVFVDAYGAYSESMSTEMINKLK